MKFSKATIITTISALAVAGAALGFYLISNQDTAEVKSWKDSNWLYKRTITVSNSTGGTLTNEDVLITVDSATLVTAGKLQNDCDDFRFVDSDESTYLTYWVEGGCNTATTRVWVRIPSLLNGGESIYMYYGNSSATNSEASWSGNFISLYDATCPTGWTRDSNFDGKFPYGSATGGTTGGSSSHTHGDYSGSSSARGSNSYATGSATGYVASHSHGYDLTTNTTSNIFPPYLDMIFCDKNKYDQYTGMITLFDTTVPSGWTRFFALDAVFPRGASTYGGTGGATTHTHTYASGTTNTASASKTSSGGTDVSSAVGSHSHTWSGGSLDAANNMPPYISTIWGEANNTTILSTAIFMTTVNPPLGWTAQTAFNDNFFYGGSTYGTTGGTATHSHDKVITTSSATGKGTNLGTASLGQNGNHTITIATNSISNLPPYYSVIVSKRNTSQNTSLGSEVLYNRIPNAPTSLLTEGATNPIDVADTTPEFSAIYTDPDTIDTADYYQVEVNTNGTFTGTVMWNSTKTAFGSPIANGSRSSDISYAGSTLQKDTTYYWRIKFFDDGVEVNEGSWSSAANFKTDALPNAPTNLLTEGAVNPISIPDMTPEFSAIFSDTNSADTGTYYEIEVNKYSDFSGSIMWESGKTSITPITNGSRSSDISYANSNLVNGATYYWRIKFWDNNNNESSWSSGASFNMNAKPIADSPLCENVANTNTKVTTATPKFSAIFTDADTADTGVYYEIEVTTFIGGTVMWNTGKTSMTPLARGSRTPDFTYAGTTLASGAKYYWKIRFWDNNDNLSEWISRSLIMQGPPVAPTSLQVNSQTDPIQLSSPFPLFTAIYSDPNSDNASAYEIEVNNSSDFTGAIMWDTGKLSTTIISGQRSPDYTYAGVTLVNTFTTHYWRIRFWDTDDSVSPWSATAQFTYISPSMYFQGVGLEGIKIN